MGDYRQSKLQHRYLNDPTFHKVVLALENMIIEHGLTPSELREALFLAHYKYEMENPKAMDDRMQKLMDVYRSRVSHDRQ